MRSETTPDRKLKRRLNILFRIGIMFTISVIIVYLLPKVGHFQYEYQKGIPWRYETLIAPFDFPIYKTDDELQEEREKITEEQIPIFNLNSHTAHTQTEKFKAALHPFNTESAQAALSQIVKRLTTIYQAGILQLPEELDARKIRNIKIVENKIAQTVRFSQVYTLKKAYAALSEEINESGLPKSVREKILSLNLSNYLLPNLEFEIGRAHV